MWPLCTCHVGIQMPDSKRLLKVDLASVYPIGVRIPYHGTDRFAHPDILKSILSSSRASSVGNSSSLASPVSQPVLIAPAFVHSLHSLTATCLYWRGLTAARRVAVKAAGRDCQELFDVWKKIAEEDKFVSQAFHLAHTADVKRLNEHLQELIVEESKESRS